MTMGSREMRNYRTAKKRVEVSVGESVRIPIRERTEDYTVRRVFHFS